VVRLGAAASGDDQLLVFVDAVGVADRRIGGCQAGPGGGAAEICFGQAPKSVASVDSQRQFGNARGYTSGERRRRGFRKIELRADANSVGVGDPWIGCAEFRPAFAMAQILFRQFPKRIATLHAHDFSRGVRSRRQRVPRLYRANRFARRDRLCRPDKKDWRRGPGKYSWLGGNYHPRVQTNIWTDSFMKVSGYLAKGIWTDALRCFFMNVGADTATEILANVRVNICAGSCTDNSTSAGRKFGTRTRRNTRTKRNC